jgi:hypothetical protein
MYHRLFLTEDFDRCVTLLSPAFEPSDRVRAALPSLWRRLHAAGQLHGGVVVEHTSIEVLAFGMFVFLEEDFVVELLRSPVPHVSGLVYERMLSGQSPVLSARQVAAANTAHGLNMLILHFGLAGVASAKGPAGAIAAAQTGFRQCSTGYRLARVLQEAHAVAELPFFAAGGFLVKSEFDRFYAEHPGDRPPPERRPHLMGLFRTDPECRFPGNALADLFQPTPDPRVHFSAAEQRVLIHAVLDESDEAIAQRLGISHDAVMKTWRRIHHRVTMRAPEIVEGAADNASIRGKERRRRLLQYLRYHPEELRPFLRAR